MSEVKLSLLENAENFLIHSLSQAITAEKNPQNWKYAILHLVQSIELLLKELLKREHEILIYKNIDNPKETVSLEIAVTRLQNISKLKFNVEDLEKISLASTYRNQIVHYEFSFREKEIKSIFAKLLGFLQSILSSQFKKNIKDVVNVEIWKEAVQIIEYAKELQTRAQERYEKEGIKNEMIMGCRKCHQKSFVFQNGINTCYVCGDSDYIGQCEGCDKYFYLDELQGTHEYDDHQFCSKCLQSTYDYYRHYY